MAGTPRLSTGDHAALRAIEAGGADIDQVSRYWLSFYRLIDETPAGCRITARGRDYLRRLASLTYGDVVPATVPCS
ncbi:MAG: hypothetical protein KF889_16635 [Alphaproteobacteria bacterium]|nr:hypothetical protein [Alphaproteobacteria bacterium]MCW5740003.1 hypothetical protein [Alphaproteobacteria bacterium]